MPLLHTEDKRGRNRVRSILSIDKNSFLLRDNWTTMDLWKESFRKTIVVTIVWRSLRHGCRATNIHSFPVPLPLSPNISFLCPSSEFPPRSNDDEKRRVQLNVSNHYSKILSVIPIDRTVLKISKPLAGRNPSSSLHLRTVVSFLQSQIQIECFTSIGVGSEWAKIYTCV